MFLNFVHDGIRRRTGIAGPRRARFQLFAGHMLPLGQAALARNCTVTRKHLQAAPRCLRRRSPPVSFIGGTGVGRSGWSLLRGIATMRNRWLRLAAFLFAGAALQLPLLNGAAAEPYSAEDMLSECQTLLSSAKKTDDPDAIELDNTFSTGTCWGAFLSIQQLITMKMAGAKTPLFRVCVPEQTTLVQLIQIFDAYARLHPKRLNEPFTIVATAAMHEAFRCR